MKTHTKALLASALIFPGGGQLVLKRYKLASLFMVSAIAAMIFILVDVVTKALKVVDQVLVGEVEPNVLVIRKLVAQQQAHSDSQWLVIVSVLLGVIWLISIVDVYWQRQRNK